MVKIGLEVHGYLNTKEKLFCRCKTSHGLKEIKPNTNICPTCTGQPGSKPLLPNFEAIKKSIQIAILLGCKVNEKLVWKRKHYDWPDLPKGYQNTLSGPYSTPTGIDGKFLGIRIKEVHLEEDPASWNPETGEIDYNRSGSPLIEIVTEPDFSSSNQVVEWLKQLITTLSYIKCLEKNAGIKADVNISLPEINGKRVEVKNVNSIKNIFSAIEYEIIRQKKEPVKIQETRRFDEAENKTIKMREKEEADDYRFISEPDLPTLIIKREDIKKIKESIPKTPLEKLEKIIKEYHVEKKYAEILIKNIDIAEFFEEIIKNVDVDLASKWVVIELLRVLNYSKKELEEVNINPKHFIELLQLIKEKKITELKAKEILNQFIPNSFSPLELARSNSKIDSEKEIEDICKIVIKENPKVINDYKSGKKEALNFLIGIVMQKTDKRADFRLAKKILEDLIK
jgi:aspartyl-tRNA(Asn)/glutamyl-tRNA(Gln) amidotransferase subunit B